MMHGIQLPHRLTDTTLQGDPFPPKTPLPLHALIPLLPPLHTKFFELLDSELEKVDSFYAEREKEMRDRGERLKEQLNELGLHRKEYYVSLSFSTRASLCSFSNHSNSTHVQESNPNATRPSRAAQPHLSAPAALLALIQRHCRRDADACKSNNQPGLVASESGRGSMHLPLLRSKKITD